MNRFLLSSLVLLAAFAVPGGAQGEESEEGDNDPTIYPDEIIAETTDWQDGEGDPPYPWYQPIQGNATAAQEGSG